MLAVGSFFPMPEAGIPNASFHLPYFFMQSRTIPSTLAPLNPLSVLRPLSPDPPYLSHNPSLLENHDKRHRQQQRKHAHVHGHTVLDAEDQGLQG